MLSLTSESLGVELQKGRRIVSIYLVTKRARRSGFEGVGEGAALAGRPVVLWDGSEEIDTE